MRRGSSVGNVRDTVKLALDAAQQVQQKNIQYSTGFTLAPGKYHLKFVVRENQTGAMGSFETDLQVPDMKKVPLKMSSIVLASQQTPNTKKTRDGESAGAGWSGVDSECAACVPAGPASLFSVRGVRRDAAEGRSGAGCFSGTDAARGRAGAGADEHRVLDWMA